MNVAILVAMYFLWAAIPIGIITEPEITDRANLRPEEIGEIVGILKEKNAIYREGDRSRIYRKTFWTPWIRRSYRSEGVH